MDVLVSSYYERLYRASSVLKLKSNVTLDAYVSKTQEHGALRTLLAFMNVWVPFALEDPTRAMVVTYEALQLCPMQVLWSIMNGLVKARVSCEALRNAVAGGDFAKLKALGATSKERHFAQLSQSENSAKFRQGRAYAAQEAVGQAALAAAQSELRRLQPEVAGTLQTAGALCFRGGRAIGPRWMHEPSPAEISCR
eukprot:4076082-Amphidinium_carterae.1